MNETEGLVFEVPFCIIVYLLFSKEYLNEKMIYKA